MGLEFRVLGGSSRPGLRADGLRSAVYAQSSAWHSLTNYISVLKSE